MLLVKQYTVIWGRRISNISSKIEFRLRDVFIELTAKNEDEEKGIAVVKLPVNPASLFLRQLNTGESSNLERYGIDSPEFSSMASHIKLAERILALVFEAPVRFSNKMTETQLVPENDSDKRKLDDLENLSVFFELKGKWTLCAPAIEKLNDHVISFLATREIGLAILQDALSISRPIGKFREYWRVLESAFCLKDRKLVHTLSKFPPAQDLEFDEDEIKQIWILRGRASHAESRTGIDEFNAVSDQVDNNLERLKTLMMQVILSKCNWGKPDLNYESIAPLRTYTKKDNSPVYIIPR